MTELWYTDTSDISEEYYNLFSESLPIDKVKELTRFRMLDDRKLKLISRLMIMEFFYRKGLKWDWRSWKVNPSGKPEIEATLKFNISHSGKYAVVGFSDHEIGVDIEEVLNIDVEGLSDNFHEDEIQEFINSEYSLDKFYEVWTRKEAFLKAVGVGIINGLSANNCLNQQLISNGRFWNIQSLNKIKGYKLALCTENISESVIMKQVKPSELITFINQIEKNLI